MKDEALQRIKFLEVAADILMQEEWGLNSKQANGDSFNIYFLHFNNDNNLQYKDVENLSKEKSKEVINALRRLSNKHQQKQG